MQRIRINAQYSETPIWRDAHQAREGFTFQNIIVLAYIEGTFLETRKYIRSGVNATLHKL